MTINQTNSHHAKNVASKIAADHGKSTGVLAGVWNWVNGVANGVSHFIGTTLLGGFKSVRVALESVLHAFGDYYKAVIRVMLWFQILIWHTVRGWIAKERQRAQAQVQQVSKSLMGVIRRVEKYLLAVIHAEVYLERVRRIKDVARAEAKARAEVKALHGTIEREAASAYQVDKSTRVDLIVKLLDYAATRQPELKAILGDVVKGTLDLLEVDDPALRILLGFLMREVIDRLGIDKALGGLIGDLIDTITGQATPRNLHAVIMDICKRLDASEAQWSQFMQDGGSQVEQAGTDWKQITSVLGNAAIVAFTVQGVVDPSGWAGEIADTVGAAANDLAVKAAQLFGG